MCPDTKDLRESISQDICSLINNSVLPALNPGHGVCRCGGYGWRKTASIWLIQHRPAHQLGSSSLLQEGPVLDPLMLALPHVILLCSL